nr:MAG TPA: hypothetical protein [Caudoviricetes sp.]
MMFIFHDSRYVPVILCAILNIKSMLSPLR